MISSSPEAGPSLGTGVYSWASPRVLAPLLLLGTLNLALCAVLWPQWTGNPDLSHGLFMPLVFAVLLHESRKHGTRRLLRDSPTLSALTLALLAGGFSLLGVGGLYALVAGWSHSIPNLATSLAFCAFGLATLLTLSRRSVRLWWFNWPALTAFGLWILCAPFTPSLWARFTLKLQLGVTTAVIDALHILGIPAMQHGNIIELARTSVGVEDACSGVRSLISCVFTGLFLSACMVRHFSSRIILIGLSAPLAIGMNFIRSLTLTILANKGVKISGTWHDITGFGILGATALLLIALAALLSRVERNRLSNIPPAEPEPGNSAARRSLTMLTSGLGLSFIVALTFAIASKPTVKISHKIPDLENILPTQVENWKVVSAPDLLRFSQVLQTDKLVQRDYLRAEPDGLTQVTIYLAYWAPGQSNPSQVAIHTPDGCWPGAGWSRLPYEPARGPLTISERTLPDAEQRIFQNQESFKEYVWYWHLYDGHPIVQLDPYDVIELLEMSVRYGFNRSSDQLFVRISSNRPWNAISHDPLFTEIFRKLKAQGL